MDNTMVFWLKIIGAFFILSLTFFYSLPNFNQNHKKIGKADLDLRQNWRWFPWIVGR